MVESARNTYSADLVSHQFTEQWSNYAQVPLDFHGVGLTSYHLQISWGSQGLRPEQGIGVCGKRKTSPNFCPCFFPFHLSPVSCAEKHQRKEKNALNTAVGELQDGENADFSSKDFLHLRQRCRPPQDWGDVCFF